MLEKVFTAEFWARFWMLAVERVLSRGLLLTGIILGYLFARAALFRLLDVALTRIVQRQTRDDGKAERASRLLTLKALARSISGYVLLFIFLIMALDALGANVMGILTTAGVGGLAIGFGAQKLVRDVISGFFFIVEDQFGMGEYVTIGPATGVVEELGMRTTRIRDDQGKLWILANGDISTIVNHSRASVESSIEIGLKTGADLDRAREVIADVGRELFERQEEGRLVTAPRVAGIAGWDAARVTLRVTVVAEPAHQAAEQLRVRQAIYERLAREGIPVG